MDPITLQGIVRHAQHRGLLARAPKSFMFPVLVPLSLIPSTRTPDVNTYAELAGGCYTPGEGKLISSPKGSGSEPIPSATSCCMAFLLVSVRVAETSLNQTLERAHPSPRSRPAANEALNGGNREDGWETVPPAPAPDRPR
ncbi:unnamed protein product [Gadus morhua 'NCC']